MTSLCQGAVVENLERVEENREGVTDNRDNDDSVYVNWAKALFRESKALSLSHLALRAFLGFLFGYNPGSEGEDTIGKPARPAM